MELLRIYLHTIADVTFNRLSKTDLFNLDVNMKILRTPPTHLVNSLTSFELYRLSQIFLSLSSSDNQYITYYKFHEIFNNYFHTIMPEIDSNETKIRKSLETIVQENMDSFYFKRLRSLSI